MLFLSKNSNRLLFPIPWASLYTQLNYLVANNMEFKERVQKERRTTKRRNRFIKRNIEKKITWRLYYVSSM